MVSPKQRHNGTSHVQAPLVSHQGLARHSSARAAAELASTNVFAPIFECFFFVSGCIFRLSMCQKKQKKTNRIIDEEIVI